MRLRSTCRNCLCFIGLSLCVLLSLASHADDNRLRFLELNERGHSQVEINWRGATTPANTNRPALSLGACQTLTVDSPSPTNRKQLWRCASPIGGSQLNIANDPGAPAQATLIRINWQSGETQNLLLPAGESSIQLPESVGVDSVSARYFVYGFEHILIGFDHLLFIACLVIIAGRFKTLLITVTGFTLAHSITLALSVLQIATVSVVAIEALIALSIVFLATELIRNNRSKLTWRHPVSVSSSFGLLHGFGFAAVLNDLGLPSAELGKALLFFNVGVEVGQLAFIAGLLCCRHLLTKALLRSSSTGSLVGATAGTASGLWQLLIGYGVGSLASFWVFERLVIQ